MTFYGYMKRNYYNKTGRKADLANDMASDETEFPTRVGIQDRDGHGVIRGTSKAVGHAMPASMSLKSAGRSMSNARKSD